MFGSCISCLLKFSDKRIMKVLILLAIVASAVAVRECPENSRYQSCGTACPLTCDNYNDPPKACVLMCNPGCHCDAGYVKTNDGRCVAPESCPNQAEVCGRNEQYTECGTSCPLTCDNYQNPPKICNLMCNIGCECQKGYVKNAEGSCVLPRNCPSLAEESNCVDEPETGLCRGYFPSFYYDGKSGTCKEFIYGGCGGNGNRYGSEEQCKSSCGAVQTVEVIVLGLDCDKAPETGVCNAYMPRYYFDQQDRLCKEFIYGGCGGNHNNFKNKAECIVSCIEHDSVPNSACDEEKEVGPCRAAFPRYFFNKKSGQCEHFIYGGCNGNSNNFESQDDCESVCIA